MKKKALLYCSNSIPETRELLRFQEEILSMVSMELGYEIFAVCKDECSNDSLKSFAMQKIFYTCKEKRYRCCLYMG